MINHSVLLTSRRYDVEFVDGYSETLSANILAENLIAQVGQERHRQRMLKEISDHRCNDRAIKIEDGTFTTSRGLKQKRRTTAGWELYVDWKDNGGNWIELKDLKHAYPVELAEYAIKSNIQHEPAFAWWIPWTMKKREMVYIKTKDEVLEENS